MKYHVKRQIFTLLGAVVRTYNEQEQLVCMAKQKAFKLKEEIHFYHDEAKTQLFFSVKARKVLDFSATYDITDATGKHIASLKRQGLSSAFVRDIWEIHDVNGQQMGQIAEDSDTLGVLRRHVDMISLFLPQKYDITMGSEHIGSMQQNRNPFTLRLECEYDDSKVQYLGTILPIAIPSMLSIIDARQG
jgi:uncharacterized protein YxjI